MIRYLIIALLLMSPLGILASSYAQTKEASMIKQEMTHLKLYIGVRYFASIDPSPFDFTISIDEKVIVDNELFPKGDILDETRHGPDHVMVELPQGRHTLTVRTVRGNAELTKEFTITSGTTEAFAQVNYNFIPLGANMAGYTPPLDFQIQRSDFGWR